MIVDFSIIESDAERVSYLQEIGNYIENGMITPEKISEALANYFACSSWLATIMEATERENNKIKIEYEIWESEKLVDTKSKLSEGLSKQLKASQGEIKNQMIVDNKEEYKEWQNRLSQLERSEGFYRRLCQNFSMQGQMLIQLAQMQRSEMIALGVEKKANEDLTKEALNRHVKVKKVRIEE